MARTSESHAGHTHGHLQRRADNDYDPFFDTLRNTTVENQLWKGYLQPPFRGGYGNVQGPGIQDTTQRF